MTSTPDMTCKELVEHVTDYLEGVLSPEVRAAFESHLEVCSGCQLYLGQMRLTLRALRALGPDGLSSETHTRLLQHYRSWRAAGP